MNPDYWLNRWQTKNTGWHQTEVEPALITWASKRTPARILVPLCGKSLDLNWLRTQHYEVIGVELSTEACEQFFSENQLPVAKEMLGPFTAYTSKNITILNGDFFQLTSELLGTIGAIYDRAALIALPREMRNRYAKHLRQLVTASAQTPEFEWLQILLTREPSDSEGPPFSIEASELQEHYETQFEIEFISKEKVEARAPAGSETHESVFLLKARKN